MIITTNSSHMTFYNIQSSSEKLPFLADCNQYRESQLHNVQRARDLRALNPNREFPSNHSPQESGNLAKQGTERVEESGGMRDPQKTRLFQSTRAKFIGTYTD